MFEHLFAPIKIRDMELKNRIILPAMGTRMAAENGAVTDKLIAYHAARAKGGCALNIVEVAAVHTPSAPAHFVSISEDYLIEGHKKLTDAIHENGGKAGIQLWQGSIVIFSSAQNALMMRKPPSVSSTILIVSLQSACASILCAFSFLPTTPMNQPKGGTKRMVKRVSCQLMQMSVMK